MSSDQTYTIFFAVWVILVGVSVYFFVISTDVERKRKNFKPFLTFSGLLFLGFLWTQDLPAAILAMAVAMVLLIIFLNIRMIRFCDSCGKTVFNRLSFSTPRFCSHCGEKL